MTTEEVDTGEAARATMQETAMCVAVPGRVEQVEESVAVVDVGGATVRVRLDLCPDTEEGEWVLVHAGFALEKVDEEYAKETLALLAEIDSLKDALPEGAP